ncbi:MAG: tRNA 2-selenouridine(34) synthase MnmH [Planctomycetota bacterium]
MSQPAAELSEAWIEPDAVWPRGGEVAAYQLIDVRAPVEVAKSQLPDAVTLPILDDGERQQVGACYHQQGSEAAFELAIALTAPVRSERVAGWRQACEAADRPTAMTCWRGGDRSKVARQWLGDAAVPRVRGGAKELRRFLLASLEQRMAEQQLLVVAGLTGAGKTDALHAIQAAQYDDLHVLDLEGLAHHRGSVFGGRNEPQPAQASFENELALSLHLTPASVTVVEDEARNVGRLLQPQCMWRRVQHAPVAVLEAPLAERIERIAREYAIEPARTRPRRDVREGLEAALQKLRKRLGPVASKQCLELLAAADRDDHWHSVAAHEPWIRLLLEGYYDKHYAYALESSERDIPFRGTLPELLEWLGSGGLKRTSRAAST